MTRVKTMFIRMLRLKSQCLCDRFDKQRKVYKLLMQNEGWAKEIWLKDCRVNVLNIFWHPGKLEFRPYIGTDLWGNIVKMSKIIWHLSAWEMRAWESWVCTNSDDLCVRTCSCECVHERACRSVRACASVCVYLSVWLRACAFVCIDSWVCPSVK